ncbi:MAG: ferredoxin [Jatrophihabitantaceae bacterium]
MKARRGEAPADRLLIDPTNCDGIGMCSHLAPDLVTVDSWGYPILVQRILERGELRSARRAVAGCPRKALFIAAE